MRVVCIELSQSDRELLRNLIAERFEQARLEIADLRIRRKTTVPTH
ncbi:hypothetical protein [Methylomicrobium lacus]